MNRIPRRVNDLESALSRLVKFVESDNHDEYALKRARKTLEEKQSPALLVLNTAFHSMMNNKKTSWRSINGAMRNAVTAVVTGGVEFHEGDLGEIWGKMNADYWMLNDAGSYGEWIYTLAIEKGNNTAWKSFETWRGRSPFITYDKKRLHVGAEFLWEGDRVTVTSFNDDQGHLIACVYEKKEHKSGVMVKDTSRIIRRYTITNGMLKAHNKKIRDYEKAQEKPHE